VQVAPFADILPGRLVSHLEATNPTVAAAATDFLQQLKKKASAKIHEVQRLLGVRGEGRGGLNHSNNCQARYLHHDQSNCTMHVPQGPSNWSPFWEQKRSNSAYRLLEELSPAPIELQ
jgi:hypothetical protein